MLKECNDDADNSDSDGDNIDIILVINNNNNDDEVCDSLMKQYFRQFTPHRL
jgi:hypothetical protein